MTARLFCRARTGILMAVNWSVTSCLLALVTVVATACTNGPYRMPAAAQSMRSDSIPIPPGTKRIEIQFHDGLLAVERGDEARCEVETRLQAADATTLATYERSAMPIVEQGAEPASIVVRASLPTGAPIDSVRTAWRLRVTVGTALVVTTRCGAVVVRGMDGDLVVNGGSGVVEATLAGGTARIMTTSGSLILRGSYSRAEVRSTIGRIDLALPSTSSSEARASTRTGEIFVELGKGQWFDARMCGETNLVRCDAEVPGEWSGTEEHDGIRWSCGRLGDLTGARSGALWITSEHPVYVRLLAVSPFPIENEVR